MAPHNAVVILKSIQKHYLHKLIVVIFAILWGKNMLKRGKKCREEVKFLFHDLAGVVKKR